jgi:hypothetical protein
MSKQDAIILTSEGSLVDSSQLSAEGTQLLWQGMHLLDPKQAELWATDDMIKALHRRFGVNCMVRLEDYRRFVKAAQAAAAAKEQGNGNAN